MGAKTGSDTEVHLKGLREATVGIHRGGGSEIGCSSDHCGETIPVYAPAHTGTHSGPFCFSVLPFMAKVPLPGREQVHILREWNQLRSKPKGFCSSILGPNPTADRVIIATEHRRSHGSHLDLALSPPSLNPTSKQGDIC